MNGILEIEDQGAVCGESHLWYGGVGCGGMGMGVGCGGMGVSVDVGVGYNCEWFFLESLREGGKGHDSVIPGIKYSLFRASANRTKQIYTISTSNSFYITTSSALPTLLTPPTSFHLPIKLIN